MLARQLVGVRATLSRAVARRHMATTVTVFNNTVDGMQLRRERRQRQIDHKKARREMFARRRSETIELPEPVMGNVLHMETPTLELDMCKLTDKSVVERVTLDNAVWGEEIRPDLVHRAVCYERASWRSGTATVLHRGQVSGSTAKLRPQKGSGRSRAGDARMPHWRGGGKAFGKVQKDWAHKLPFQLRNKALKSALAAKFQEGNVHIIDEPEIGSHRTADMVDVVQDWDFSRVLLLHGENELANHVEFTLAARNIKQVDFENANDLGVYNVVLNHQLLVTRKGLAELEERLTRPRHNISFVTETPPRILLDPELI